MKKLRRKTIRIIESAATVVGIVSGFFTVLYNPMLGNNIVVFVICLIFTLICIIIISVAFVYYGIAALQVYSSKKKERIDYDSFKKSVEKVGEQYAEFQKYVQSMEQSIGDKIVCPAGNATFKYNSTDVSTETKLFLVKHPNAEIHIICYGRNVYGEVIDHIREKKLNVKVKIIVYNPSVDSSICRRGDDTRIYDHIVDILNGKIPVEVYASNIPPSIRACVIYEKNDERLVPVWGTVQSYRFEKNSEGGFAINKPDKSLIAICGKKTINEDFKGMVECFEDEFSYLQEDCCKVILVNNELEFIPYNMEESI